jgi:hypothetical protein
MACRIFPLLLLTLFLTACGWMAQPLPGLPTPAGPTATPRILTPTPAFVYPATPSLTATITATSLAADTAIPPSATPTPTASPTLIATLTPTLAPALTVAVIGCNTSLDVTHGMGEVTNAFAILANPGGIVLHNVCATLSASDEDRLHPDKTACVAALANGYQVTLKLTVDTGFRVDTSIQVEVTSDEGLTAAASSPSCTDLSIFTLPPGELGVPMAIP